GSGDERGRRMSAGGCCIPCFFFFFQAEDGIRDRNVTGVQTCALPICRAARSQRQCSRPREPLCPNRSRPRNPQTGSSRSRGAVRSEERRVGKEWRSRWAPGHEKKREGEREREGREERSRWGYMRGTCG